MLSETIQAKTIRMIWIVQMSSKREKNHVQK